MSHGPVFRFQELILLLAELRTKPSSGLLFSERTTLEQLQCLLVAVEEVHSQKADDKCWMDNSKIYEAAGLPPADKTVGDKFAMLKNCARYIEDQCDGGGAWKSYAELERLVVAQNELIHELSAKYARLSQAMTKAAEIHGRQARDITVLKEITRTMRQLLDQGR